MKMLFSTKDGYGLRCLMAGIVFVILSVAVRFQVLDVRAFDSVTSFVVQVSLQRKLTLLFHFGTFLNHWWVIALAIVILFILLRYQRYHLAANFWIISLLFLVVINLFWFLLVDLSWNRGFEIEGNFPDLLLTLWLYYWLSIYHLFIRPLCHRPITYHLFHAMLILFFVFQLLSQINQGQAQLSGALAAVLLAYTWWQIMSWLYGHFAKHWQRVLQIDGGL
ncbi:hypothetical protein [Convivina praedatoris]|uniref:Uncharacterized protein n=1 Tax=Convivina praedatoris TaxID=2880963 RepID=A0ABN8HCB1_9LACO|nr:hypothetical protein [Convivina sp. LMG 32447]CAH1851568.1 hypothetical protein LMG032447_00349 [Convivina sp. LMG 32447]CAH1851592.1 hypothetical protein R078138_00359 [Convivina sp. LMG 32447]CAH1853203.1 hypothetical protein R077815_00758 [Convivina sp. LMG 32447]